MKYLAEATLDLAFVALAAALVLAAFVASGSLSIASAS